MLAAPWYELPAGGIARPAEPQTPAVSDLFMVWVDVAVPPYPRNLRHPPTTGIDAMLWVQRDLTLAARPRGFHLITDEVLRQLPEIARFAIGTAHFFLRHTSASLALNENADPDVRHDLEAFFSRLVPENQPYFRHTLEGPDDMPAHIKAVVIGPSVTVPVREGRLYLGTWQGLYLCEHRDRGGARRLTVTLMGRPVP